MSKPRPIATTNAIEAAAFGLVFARDFENHEIEALFSLEHSLKDLKPNFIKENEIHLQVSGNMSTEQTQRISGVLVQLFQENGKLEWSMRVAGNRIIVNCLKYDKWDNVWPKARLMLLKAAQCVDSETNGVINLIHQVIDKFVYDEKPAKYLIGDVFNLKSIFLTPHVITLGELWHLFQGWFEETPSALDGKQRTLNVVNLSSSLANEKLVTSIDNNLQAVFSKPIDIKLYFDKDIPEKGSEFINDQYKQLHEKNAELLRNILNDDQLMAIGIKQ